MLEKARRLFAKLRRTARRKHDEICRPCRYASRRDRRLIDHHVRVRAAEAERAHRRTTTRAALKIPVAQRRVHVERASGELDVRIAARVVERCRYLPMSERKQHFDDAS